MRLCGCQRHGSVLHTRVSNKSNPPKGKGKKTKKRKKRNNAMHQNELKIPIYSNTERPTTKSGQRERKTALKTINTTM